MPRRQLAPWVLALALLVAGCEGSGPVVAPTPASSLADPPSAGASATTTVEPTATESPQPPPAPRVRALRLDTDHLLLTTSLEGNVTRVEVLGRLGRRTPVVLPVGADSDAFPAQAFVSAGAWYVEATSCALGDVRLLRSDDAGATWRGSHVGGVGCHAGDVATVFRTASRWLLVSSTGVGEGTTVSWSDDGVHWPRRSQHHDDGPSTFAFRYDGSYVRAWGFSDEAGQELVRAAGYGLREHTVHLPGTAEPLGYTLRWAGDRYVVLSSAGRPYVSGAGDVWTGRAKPFGSCRCSLLGLEPLTSLTWWARGHQGDRARYALTRDGGRSWREVSGPPDEAVHPDWLLGWNATSAVVERDDATWLTTDTGRTWHRL